MLLVMIQLCALQMKHMHFKAKQVLRKILDSIYLHISIYVSCYILTNQSFKIIVQCFAKKDVGLNGPVFCHVDQVILKMMWDLIGPSHIWSGVRLVRPSHNRDSWTLYLYALSELIAYFQLLELLRLIVSTNDPTVLFAL